MIRSAVVRVCCVCAAICALTIARSEAARLQRAAPASGASAAGVPALYKDIKAFHLSGASAEVTNFVLKRDRVEMTLTGTFYFADPVADHVTGAVFIGQGHVRSEVPPVQFEQDSVHRLLGADVVESDFKTAVMRMSDDTYDVIQRGRQGAGSATAPRTDVAMSADALELAAKFEPRVLEETGINLSARIALSILNAETPGVFFATFDGGQRGRFSVVFDPQTRIPSANFGIDGGEKGLFFTFQSAIAYNDVWMGFYGQHDYETGTVAYSDASDLVDITHYTLMIDVRDPGAHLRVAAHIDMKARVGNLRAIPFRIGESLSSGGDVRLNNQMRLEDASIGGQPVPAVQEDWEGGFTVFLPAAANAGDSLAVDLDLDGNFLRDANAGFYYLRDNVAWLPRHGTLDRATFDLTFRHNGRSKIASIGVRGATDQPDPANPGAFLTHFTLTQPAAIASFALGPYERVVQSVSWESGAPPIPLEVDKTPDGVRRADTQFILAEMDNAVRYFAAFFGPYPFTSFSAAFHPYPFGQSFPALLLIPPVDVADPHTFVFISHETSHQWWGHTVLWRSYRDQWLSEGFAEYSGMMYTGARMKPQAETLLINEARRTLTDPPRTATGITKGRLVDIGPIILGRRLDTSKSFGTYTALIYSKGALVLRMLHFLLSDPTTGRDAEFVAMMRDFTQRYRGGTATTENFRDVAGDHFAKTPLAQKYGLTDLRWFFDEWVYRPGLPIYSADYTLTAQPDGSCMIAGTLHQDNVPAEFSMPLPIVFTFAGNQQARAVIRAVGSASDFQLKLPAKPTKVELDPASWVLSEKTTIRAR